MENVISHSASVLWGSRIWSLFRLSLDWWTGPSGKWRPRYQAVSSLAIRSDRSAHMTAGGLDMGLYSENLSKRSKGSGGAAVRATSMAQDDFMIANPGDSVDALMNFRLSGNVYLPIPDTGYYGSNSLYVSLRVFNENYDNDFESRLFMVDAKSTSIPEGLRVLNNDFGVPVVTEGSTHRAIFSDIPLSFDFSGLPLNEPLTYTLGLGNYMVNFAWTNFAATLTFDSEGPIVLDGVDGIYTLTSTTGSFGLGESVDQGYQIVIGQAPVPEPTTLALIGLGLIGIGYQRHRIKKVA